MLLPASQHIPLRDGDTLGDTCDLNLQIRDLLSQLPNLIWFIEIFLLPSRKAQNYVNLQFYLLLNFDPAGLLYLCPEVHVGPALLQGVQLVQDPHGADLEVGLNTDDVRTCKLFH